MLKKYMVSGLLEWKALIPAGRAHVRVEFSGGRMGSSGITPAEFVTDDPGLQKIIEESEYFLNGKIKVYPGPMEGRHRETISPKSPNRHGEGSTIARTGGFVEIASTRLNNKDNDENECRGFDQNDTDQDGRESDEFNQC